MKFTPKHKDATLRLLYFGLFILSVVFMSMRVSDGGFKRTAYICISLITLVSALYLLMRYELTTFTYILNPNGNNYDFFVNKAVGKRGSYVCSYRVSDIIEVMPYEKNTKEQLKKENKEILIFDYTHNLFKSKKQVILFANEQGMQAVVVELGEEMYAFLLNVINLVREANTNELALEIEEELGNDISLETNSDLEIKDAETNQEGSDNE